MAGPPKSQRPAVDYAPGYLPRSLPRLLVGTSQFPLFSPALLSTGSDRDSGLGRGAPSALPRH